MIPIVYAFFFLPLPGSHESLTELMNFDHSRELPLKFVIFNWGILLQTILYLILTVFVLRTYRKNIKTVFSNIEKLQLDWLRNLTVLMIFVVAFFLIENILFLLDIQVSEAFNLSSAVVALSIYIMGYMGMAKSDIFSRPDIANSMQTLSTMKIKNQKTATEGENKKYSKSGLDDETAQAYLNELISLMEDEHVYRNSDLTLSQLAAPLGISAHNLSQVLNSTRGQNFFDFVNSYRVNDVIASFNDSDKNHLKILALAFDAGFNSKTTFNSIFKKMTGETPSEYRQKNS
jgi:AraC-like DNA-binding protein